MKPHSSSPAQQARIETLARHFGMQSEVMISLAIDLGLSVLEKRLSENGNHQLPALSTQQGNVIALLQQGKTVKEIAFQLNMGEATVRTHIKRLKDKLGCNDLLDLRMKEMNKTES